MLKMAYFKVNIHKICTYLGGIFIYLLPLLTGFLSIFEQKILYSRVYLKYAKYVKIPALHLEKQIRNIYVHISCKICMSYTYFI